MTGASRHGSSRKFRILVAKNRSFAATNWCQDTRFFGKDLIEFVSRAAGHPVRNGALCRDQGRFVQASHGAFGASRVSANPSGKRTANEISEVEMSSTSSTHPDPSLTAASFRQTCGFCGCVFRVEITRRVTYSYFSKSPQDTQGYSCPECRRDSRIKTSTPPRVSLISKRTDGRKENCPAK